MSKFRISTRLAAGGENDQYFNHRIEAENAAAELARSGFSSSVYEASPDKSKPYVQWIYLCEYAPDPKAVQS